MLAGTYRDEPPLSGVGVSGTKHVNVLDSRNCQNVADNITKQNSETKIQKTSHGIQISEHRGPFCFPIQLDTSRQYYQIRKAGYLKLLALNKR